MVKIPSEIRDKIKLNSAGEKGAMAKIEFIQSIKYRQNLDYQVNRVINFMQKFPNSGYGELALLCDKYGSDKGSVYFEQNKRLHAYPWLPHTYVDIYEVLFSDIRYNVKNLFECGIGTNDENIKSNMSKKGKPGASLRVWKEYFTNAQIYGADIDRNCLFEEERIKTGFIDQTSPECIKEYFSKFEPNYFDIMIDDGLHNANAALTLFEYSIEFLTLGGIYIIEDLSVDDMYKIQEKLSLTNKYIVSYIVMDNGTAFDNNLIVIKKRD